MTYSTDVQAAYKRLFEECMEQIENEPKEARIEITESCEITDEMRRRIERRSYDGMGSRRPATDC